MQLQSQKKIMSNISIDLLFTSESDKNKYFCDFCEGWKLSAMDSRSNLGNIKNTLCKH